MDERNYMQGIAQQWKNSRPSMVPMPAIQTEALDKYLATNVLSSKSGMMKNADEHQQPNIPNHFSYLDVLNSSVNSSSGGNISYNNTDDEYDPYNSKKKKRKGDKSLHQGDGIQENPRSDGNTVNLNSNEQLSSVSLSHENLFQSSASVPVNMSTFVNSNTSTGINLTNETVGNYNDIKKVFKCNICSKEYTSKYFFTLHEKSHAGVDNIHECSFCSYITQSESQLQLHTKYIHELGAPEIPKQTLLPAQDKCFDLSVVNKDIIYPALEQNRAVIKAQQEEFKPFKCDLCQARFRRKQDLSRHARSHEIQEHKCLKCGMVFSSAAKLSEHEVLHNIKEVFCHRCGLKFPHSFHLQMHQTVCVLENPVTMMPGQNQSSDKLQSTMPVTFSGSTSQDKTQTIHRTVNSNLKQNSCEVCGKNFSTNFYLRSHMRTHTGERPYPCSDCGKCFSQASVLKTHRRIHTGEKPYVCDTCGKAFSVRLYLQVHVRTHTGEKPYECSNCGRCFSQKSAMVTHKKKQH